MHTHTHSPESPAQTEGRLIHWASFYDGLANITTFGQASRLRRMTVDQALLQPGENVLDVGCGTGGVTIPAKLRVGINGGAPGIDPAPEMLAIARRKAKRVGIEIDFRIGVIESLPFPDGTFDVVTSRSSGIICSADIQIKTGRKSLLLTRFALSVALRESGNSQGFLIALARGRDPANGYQRLLHSQQTALHE